MAGLTNAIVSSLALAISIWRFSLGKHLSVAAAIIDLVALGAGIWIADSG